jgi:hypothetical protein
MFVNVVLRKKDTGEIIDTDEGGVWADISFNSDGSIDITALGTCIDNSTRTEPDTIEKELNVNEYELVSIDLINTEGMK